MPRPSPSGRSSASAAAPSIAQSGKVQRTSTPLKRPLEVFGAPKVTVTESGNAAWTRLVAVLSARTPAGKEIVVAGGGVPLTAGAHTPTIYLNNQATFIPAGSTLTVTLASSSLAQNPGNLLYLDLPLGSGAQCHDRAGVRVAPRVAGAGLPVKRAAVAGALTALALGLAATAAATATGDPGVTATTVLLGGTVPLSGEAAAFGSVGPGAKAYFDYVNARGGVNGRTIDYRFYDDGYNPAQTVQLTRKLVEQDKVLRRLQLRRHRQQPRRSRVPERAARAAAVRRRRLRRARATAKIPLDDGLPAELPRRGRASTGGTSRDGGRRRGSRSCSRTPTSARTWHAGLSRAIAGKGPQGRRLRELRVHGEPTCPPRSRS